MSNELLEIEIPAIKRKVLMPLSLSRCDQRQYVEFCGLLYQHNHKGLSFDDFLILSVYALLNLKRGKEPLSEEASENIYRLSEFLTGFFNKDGDTLKLNLDYRGNVIKSVNPGFMKRFYGPNDYFTDVTFGEYEMGLDLFFSYRETQNVEYLYKLLALYFVPKRRGKRKKLPKEKYESHTKLMRTLPEGYAYGFYYNFAAFHTYFTSTQVSYEGKVADLSIIFTDQPEDESDNYESPYSGLGMKSIAFQLAESGVFGTLEEVRDTNLWEAVFRMYDIRKRDLDHKAKTKSNESQS